MNNSNDGSRRFSPGDPLEPRGSSLLEIQTEREARFVRYGWRLACQRNEERVATREQTDGADPSESHDAQAAHKNTPIPATQGEGLAAALQAMRDLSGPLGRARLHLIEGYNRKDPHLADQMLEPFQRLREALESPPTAPPLDEWQPIETAPDGKRVMLATEHIAHPGTVYWALGDAKFVWLPPQVHGKPTHWKPIGNLPNAGGEA